MSKLAPISLLCLVLLSAPHETPAQGSNNAQTAAASTVSDREQDGFTGPVRRVRVETARVTLKDGRSVESPRILRALTSYDFQGKRIDNVAHPVDSPTMSGKEQYRYDDRGNIIEMVLRSENGSILSKETYQYEFDELGNWKKMTTSLAVYENGTLGFEPVEVTYRTITYYYNQAIDKLGQATAVNRNTSVPKAPPANKPRANKPVDQPAASVKTDAAEEKKTTTQLSSNQPVKMESKSSSPLPSAPKTNSTESNASALREASTPSQPGPKTENTISQPAQSDLSTRNPGPTVPTETASNNAKRVPESPAEAPRSSSSSNASAFYDQGVAHLRAGRNQEAVAALKQAVNLDPEDGRSYAKLGVAYAASGQHKEALAAFKLAVKIKPDTMDAEASYRMAESYTAAGKYKEALEAYKQALYTKRAETLEASEATRFPTMADLHFGLGLAYYNRESFTDAIKELKQAAALEPNSVDIQYGMALAYLANGDRSSAQRQEKILRPLDPALADNIATALSSATPPGITRIMPREDRRMRP